MEQKRHKLSGFMKNREQTRLESKMDTCHSQTLFLSNLDKIALSLLPDGLQHPDEAHTSHILSGSRGYRRASSLLIRAVDREDSGTYRCSAHNERGSSATALRLDVCGECPRTSAPSRPLNYKPTAAGQCRRELSAVRSWRA